MVALPLLREYSDSPCKGNKKKGKKMKTLIYILTLIGISAWASEADLCGTDYRGAYISCRKAQWEYMEPEFHVSEKQIGKWCKDQIDGTQEMINWSATFCHPDYPNVGTCVEINTGSCECHQSAGGPPSVTCQYSRSIPSHYIEFKKQK